MEEAPADWDGRITVSFDEAIDAASLALAPPTVTTDGGQVLATTAALSEDGRTVELLLGLSAVELLCGFVALLLTFLTARLLGFRSAGAIPLALLISVLASLATVGIGMFVASLSRNMIRAFLIASVAMFLFGIATLAYPPLRLIITSVTTSVAIIVGGIALMVLPTLIVGNELLILGGVAVGVGGWFLAHRHGQLKGFVDANKNGVDDRLETSATKN